MSITFSSEQFFLIGTSLPLPFIFFISPLLTLRFGVESLRAAPVRLSSLFFFPHSPL